MKLTRVEKRLEFDDFIAFSTSCSCGCDSRMSFDLDKESEMVSINSETLSRSFDSNILKRIYWRIKTAWRVLLTGEVQGYSEIIITDPEHLKDLKQALEYAETKLKIFQETD